MDLWFVALMIFVLNIPFGYWRANVMKFSFQWILVAHLPVPFVIGLRFISGLGFELITYPVLIGAFFSGQYLGGIIHEWRKKNTLVPISSCLVWDIVKINISAGKWRG